jgi:hypothetical protein
LQGGFWLIPNQFPVFLKLYWLLIKLMKNAQYYSDVTYGKVLFWLELVSVTAQHAHIWYTKYHFYTISGLHARFLVWKHSFSFIIAIRISTCIIKVICVMLYSVCMTTHHYFTIN